MCTVPPAEGTSALARCTVPVPPAERILLLSCVRYLLLRGYVLFTMCTVLPGARV